MKIQKILFTLILWGACGLFGYVLAQDEPLSKPAVDAAAAPEPPDAAPKIAPDVRLDVLRILLKPLTYDELKSEADTWQKMVQAKAVQIAHAEVKALSATGPSGDSPVQAANQMREERTALIDKQKAVLEAWRSKGAAEEEIKPYSTYLSSISGVTIRASKPGSAIATLRAWLGSSSGGMRWGMNLGKFFLVLVVTWIVAAMVNRLMHKVAERTSFSELLENFLANTSRNAIKIIGVIIALSMLEVNIAPLLAGVGVAGFVIGFALQDTLANFAAGFMILLYRPYDLSDVVTAGGVSGTVQAMSLVSTTLKTPDNQKVVVPNGKIWGGTITNTTGNATRRVDVTVGCSYTDDLGQVQSVLEAVIGEQELVLTEPEAYVGVAELADSSVNFAVRAWVNTGDYGVVRAKLIRDVKERFDAEGISIPYPTQQVLVEKNS